MGKKWVEITTLDDIIQAADLLCSFTQGMDLQTFLTDDKSQSAVLMQFVIMGEAAGRLS